MFDLSIIKSAVDPVMVAEGLGLEIRKTGTHRSILCPSHDDTHFGSCILTKTGYQCFSCGSGGDIFQMAQAVNNCDFVEAVKLVADIAGLTERECEIKDSAPVFRILTQKEQELIGVYNHSVKKLVQVGEDITPEEFNQVVVDNYENGILAELETVCRNPLLELHKSDEQLYNEVVLSLCEARIAKYRAFIAAAEKPESIPSIEDATDDKVHRWFYGWTISQIKDIIPTKDIIDFFRQQIAAIESIAVKHGMVIRKITQSAGITLGQTVESALW